MRVHNDANIDAECIAQNDVGGLASDAIQLRQFLHRLRNLPAMVFDEFAAARPDVLRLVPKKSRRPDGLLKFRERRIRIIRRRAIFFEQLFCDNVDAFVGALRRKDGGHEQFERFRVTQPTLCPGISPVQRSNDFFYARGPGFDGFARHNAPYKSR